MGNQKCVMNEGIGRHSSLPVHQCCSVSWTFGAHCTLGSKRRGDKSSGCCVSSTISHCTFSSRQKHLDAFSSAKGCKLKSQPSQTNDLENWHFLLSSLALGITRIGQGLVSSVSGECDCIGQRYCVAMSSEAIIDVANCNNNKTNKQTTSPQALSLLQQ